MSDDGGREEEWTCRDDEEDPYASDGYYCDSGSSKKKRRLVEKPNTTALGYDREAPLVADAFRGHHCPICLEPIQDSAMIVACRHIYCKACLFEWLSVSDRCPLCKSQVTRVLHDIKSPEEYKVHVHAKGNKSSSTMARDSSSRESDAGSSSAPRDAQAEGFSLEARDDARGSGGGGGGRVRGAGFRSVVYRRGLAAQPPETKARRPKSADQLRPWIAREVWAATGNGRGEGDTEGDTRLVADVVEALLKDNDVDDQDGYCKVKQQLQGFLFENTASFLHELWCFRWSRMGMSAYDRHAVYNASLQPSG